MKKIVILFSVWMLMLQSVTLTNAQKHSQTSIPNCYQALDDISTSVASKSLNKVPFTQNVVLPQKYDARDEGIVTSVKYQGEFGICWAYSLVSVAETQYLKKGYATNPEDVDFNELQMAYGFYHRQNDPLNLTPNDKITSIGDGSENAYLLVGGNHMLSSYYLAQWGSLVNESSFPNTSQFDNLPNDLASKYNYDDVSFVMKDAIYLPNDDIDAIKAAIYKYGSVGTAYFSSQEYYNPYIFHDDEGKSVNHAVTLVGWDDTISKEAFASSNDEGRLPSRDGAWIMKNSWSTYAGDEGYYYLSYDMNLDTTTAFEFEKRSAYTHNYFYDGGYQIQYDNPYGLKSFPVANVFTAQQTSDNSVEVVSAVSVGIASSQTNYSVQIYRLKDNFKSPQDGEAMLEKPVSGYVEFPGSYSVALNEEVELNPGENFAVVVTLESERPFVYTSEDFEYAGFVGGEDHCQNKQSYVYNGYNWVDMNELRGSVARIRAYTTEKPLSIPLRNLKTLIKEVNTFIQSEDFKFLSDITAQTIKDLNDEALVVANDSTLSDTDYQQAFNALDMSFTSVQAEVSEAREAKDLYAVKVNEVNEWVNGEDGNLLKAKEYSTILSAIYHAYDVLNENQLKELYEVEMTALNHAWEIAKEIVAHRKELITTLSDSIQTLQDILDGTDVGYFSTTRANEAKSLISQGQSLLIDADDVAMERIQKSITSKMNQINNEITQAKVKQEELNNLFDEVNQFMMINDTYLLTEQKNQLDEIKLLYADIVAQNNIVSVYQEAYDVMNSTYREIETDVLARKEEHEKALEEVLIRLHNGISLYEESDLSIYTEESSLRYSNAYHAAMDAFNSESNDVEYLNKAANDLAQAYEQLELLLVAPLRVENIVAINTNYKTIALTWNTSEKATVYDVYRKAYDSDEFKLYKTVTDTTVDVTGVMTGKTYAFYVVAKNEAGVSEASEIVTQATTLQGKVTLNIEKVSTAKFKLSWNAIDGATRYIVYRKRNDDKMKKVLTLGAKDLEYTTAELPFGEYRFILKAGRYDSTDRVMTDSSNTVTGSVEELAPAVTLKAGSKSIKASWGKMEGVTHYQVYRATSDNGKYTKLITTTETSYTAKSLSKGKKYFFKVRGYKQYKSGDDVKYVVYTPYSSVVSAIAK